MTYAPGRPSPDPPTTLGRVASGVAHDINNALTTILGLSDWLLHELPPHAEHYADIQTIQAAAKDAARMVKRLQMAGRSAPGFPRQLPCEPAEPAPADGHSTAGRPQHVSADSRCLSVLVVDDQPGVRDSLGAMVSALGHSVTKAGDGASALDLVIARRFDVVVTDLAMPGLDGIELARGVQACRPGTGVVVITAWDTELEHVAAGGGIVLASKPVTMDGLRACLATAGDGHAGRHSLRLAPAGEAGS